MKPLLVTLTLALATTVSTARAEYYRPSAVGGTAALGAVAGALIGGHNGDRWAQGAVIGAAAGAVVGAIVDNARPVEYQTRVVQPAPVAPCAPTVVTTAPAQVVYVSAPPPPPRVVYVQRPVVVARPVVHVVVGGHDHGRRYHNRRW